MDALTRNGFRASCSIRCLLLFCLGKVRISYLIQGKEERWKVLLCQIEIVWVSAHVRRYRKSCIGWMPGH